MPTRSAEAQWEGNLKAGKGNMKFGSGAFNGAFSFASRFEEGDGTNPEELIGAALAGCYSMAFSNELDKAGYDPVSVETDASVMLEMKDDGPTITEIHLTNRSEVPGIEMDDFNEIAEATKKACPVSRALAGVEIKLEASLG